MVKNFRKIPNFILGELESISSNNIVVWWIKKISKSDILKWKYSNIWITLINNNLSFDSEVIPAIENWRFSKKNIEWYIVKNKNWTKVPHTYYAGERPIYWKWSNWYFSLYITKNVYPFKKIPPQELSLSIEVLQEEKIGIDTYYTFKFTVLEILNKDNDNFYDKLLFNLNLLQENIWCANIYSSETTREEYLSSLSVNWELFPPWTRENDLNKIIWKRTNLSRTRVSQIEERYDFIRNLNPSDMIIWESWMRRYFWAKLSDNLVIFENKEYWNALYILFENWQELSQLSRTEIQNRSADDYIRITHVWDWKKKVKIIIKNKR